MSTKKDYQAINKYRQEQMLKLATKSFYNELVKMGVNNSDIVTVSLHLLDNLMQKNGNSENNNGYYNQELYFDKIRNELVGQKQIFYEEVSISPVQSNSVHKIADWLKNPGINSSFISKFPADEKELIDYFQEPYRKYFIIQFKNEAKGLIGADHIDTASSKLEMKKFVGDILFRAKGIGKRATFLFLYYAFEILNLNKVYIYSKDTNIRNINLNAKFGFELEGIFFEDIISQKKKYDIVRMGLLKSSWSEIFHNS